MMLNLKEVTTLIAAEYSPHRTWLDRLSLRIHLLMCRHCRRYLQRLASVAGAVGGLYEAGPEAKLQAFSEGNPEALISLTDHPERNNGVYAGEAGMTPLPEYRTCVCH